MFFTAETVRKSATFGRWLRFGLTILSSEITAGETCELRPAVDRFETRACHRGVGWQLFEDSMGCFRPVFTKLGTGRSDRACGFAETCDIRELTLAEVVAQFLKKNSAGIA